MGLGDELREGLDAVAQVVGGARRVATAAEVLAGRVDVVLEHVVDEGTVARVAQAAVVAGVQQAGHELRTAASKPVASSRRTRGECLGITCHRHGNQPWAAWRKTLVCGADGCGRVYQTANVHGAHFAPAVCACGARLLPPAVPDGKPSSAEPLCSTCFDEAAAGSGRMTRDPGRGDQ